MVMITIKINDKNNNSGDVYNNNCINSNIDNAKDNLISERNRTQKKKNA